MIPDHIQRLISGYATGTLSEKQRKLLFEAALEDQELFDELARDQALKELLDTPGVKQRLIESIDVRPQDHWWAHPLPWALGGSAMAISAGLMALVFLTPSGSKPVPSNPTEVSENRPQLTVEAPPPAPQAAQPGSQKATLPGTATAPKLQNEPKTKQPSGAEPRAGTRGGPGDQSNAVDQQAEQQKSVAGLAPPSPVPTASAAPPSAPSPAIRASLAARAAVAPGRFFFDYTIHDGVLRIIPGSDGYLLVRALVGPIDRLVLSTAHVVRPTPAELRIPDGANAMVILFSTRPVQEDSTDDLADRASPRTGVSGTVEDPRPSLNSRLEVRINLP